MFMNDFFFQAEDGIRDYKVTGVQTCALPISMRPATPQSGTPEAQRWDRPEIGVNLALGLGRGQFHQFVKAAGGFGGDGAVPIALDGGVGVRAGPPGLFHRVSTWAGPPALRTAA